MDGIRKSFKKILSKASRIGRRKTSPPTYAEEEKKTNKKVDDLREEVLEALARLEQMDIEP